MREVGSCRGINLRILLPCLCRFFFFLFFSFFFPFFWAFFFGLKWSLSCVCSVLREENEMGLCIQEGWI